MERLREWWDGLGLRERRLMALFGVAAALTGVLYLVFLVSDGLHALEQKNADVRAALATLEQKRDQIVEDRGKQGDAVSQIGAEATPLATYLEKVGAEVGVQIRNQSDKPTVTKGKFHELALQITLFDVTLDQLAQYLKRIEAQPTIVTQGLKIKRSTMTKDKLDRVELTVATYRRAPEKKAKSDGESADAGK